MTIKEIQDEIVNDLNWFDESQSEEKLFYLIDLGKSLPPMDEKYKVDENLIKGCQSDVWLHADFKEGKVVYSATAAAMTPRGIISVLLKVFSNQAPKEILADDTQDFIERAGLKNFFQMTRANGLEQMIKKIKLYALAFESKN